MVDGASVGKDRESRDGMIRHNAQQRFSEQDCIVSRRPRLLTLVMDSIAICIPSEGSPLCDRPSTVGSTVADRARMGTGSCHARAFRATVVRCATDLLRWEAQWAIEHV